MRQIMAKLFGFRIVCWLFGHHRCCHYDDWTGKYLCQDCNKPIKLSDCFDPNCFK